MTGGHDPAERFKVDPPPPVEEVKAVQETIEDYTAPRALGRTLFIDLKFLRFGIDDKTLAIAFVLTALLLIFVLLLTILGAFVPNTPMLPEVIDALIKALFMAIGVVVARRISH